MRTFSLTMALLAVSSTLVGQDFLPRQVVPPTPVGPIPYAPVRVAPPAVIYPGYTYGPRMVTPLPPTRWAPTTIPVQPAPVPRAVVPASATRVSRTARYVASPSLNAPLQIDIGEQFANRRFARNRVESAPVVDVVLDANVQGWQKTATQVSLNFLESTKGARMDVRVLGATDSDTLGTTRQATVRTLGRHQFFADKPVFFDGTRFLVQRARGGVNPSNQTVGAWTKYDQIPIIGPIATRTAYRKAQERSPVTEQITANRVAEKMFPKFNKEVNDALIRANAQIAQGRQSLVEQKLWPRTLTVSSTSDFVQLGAWFDNASDKPGSIPAGAAVGTSDCRIAIHESLALAALTRLDPAGKEFKRADIDGFYEGMPGFIKVDAPKQDAAEADPVADLVQFVFDKDRPVTLSFDNRRIVAVVRVAIRPAVGPILGYNDVRIEVTPKATAREILLEPTAVSVTPVNDENGAAKQVAKLIEDRVKSRIPTLRMPRTTTVSGLGAVTVQQVTLKDGWLSLRVQ